MRQKKLFLKFTKQQKKPSPKKAGVKKIYKN